MSRNANCAHISRDMERRVMRLPAWLKDTDFESIQGNSKQGESVD